MGISGEGIAGGYQREEKPAKGLFSLKVLGGSHAFEEHQGGQCGWAGVSRVVRDEDRHRAHSEALALTVDEIVF